MKRSVAALLLIIMTLAGCTGAAQESTHPAPAAALLSATSLPPTQTPVSLPTAAQETNALPSATQMATALPAPTAKPEKTASRVEVPSTAAMIGPINYPAGINPLTGLPVSRPELLELPPALVSVSNFPVTARPQSGLSQAAIVYELYTGYGMTRYAAIYYGELPAVDGKPLTVGPIRSGRLPYEPLRSMLGGFMLFASGDETVLRELRYFTNASGPVNDVNGVFVTGELIEKIAQGYQPVVGSPSLEGLVFNPSAPAGGKDGHLLWVPYSWANQVFWRYDRSSGAYNRTQDNYDGLTFTQMTDSQTGKPLAFENVIVLFAFHNALRPEKIQIGLGGMANQPALLFRDGKVYDITWSSVDKAYSDRTGRTPELRFYDSQGNPALLKPGHTWVEVVTTGSPTYETVDSQVFSDLQKKSPGSGVWAVRFIAP